MKQKFTTQQRISYLQSLTDRSPEEDAVLEKLLSSKQNYIYSASSVHEYQKQKIAKYYQQKARKTKI